MRRIRAEMKAHGVRLRIYKSPTLKSDGDECSGYFDSTRRMVALATMSSEAEFMALLCHEYMHFKQWRDYLLGRNTRLARAWRNSLNTESMGAKGLSKKERYEAYRALLELERQAEVGSSRYLTAGEFGSELERERLRKAAALYLYTHRLMYEKQRWFNKGEGNLFDWLADPRVWVATPSHLRGVDFNRIPGKLKKLLLALF